MKLFEITPNGNASIIIPTTAQNDAIILPTNVLGYMSLKINIIKISFLKKDRNFALTPYPTAIESLLVLKLDKVKKITQCVNENNFIKDSPVVDVVMPHLKFRVKGFKVLNENI